MKSEKPDIALTYKKKNGVDKWHMKVGDKPEKGPGEYDKLVVGPGDDGIFVFEIKTPGITFNSDDPIDIRLEGAGTDLSNQFITKIVNDKLVVADPNSDQVLTEYYYQLNFVGADPLDPIITNGCCKTSLVGTSAGTGSVQLMSATGLAVVLGAAVLLAILGNVVWRYLR